MTILLCIPRSFKIEKFILNKLFLLSTVSVLMGILWFSNNLYAVVENKNNSLLLTKDVIIKKEYENKVIFLEAIVMSVYTNKKNGIKSIYLKTDLPKQVQVTIWPSLGVTYNYLPGDSIGIIGTAKTYKGKLQITPLSKNSIKKLQVTNYCSDAIAPSDIENHMNKLVKIKGLRGDSAKEIISKKSKKHHLLFTVVGEGHEYNGIMFSGTWSPNDLVLLSSGKDICIFAKISTYKGKISLQVNRVVNAANQ